jgi:NAD(P)-dependent dehydrogenase (short-subunit alcohol dehydrogenase family)
MEFSGKTAVITGGANGIGRCIAAAFKKAGARVAIVDKDSRGLTEADLYYCGDLAEEETLHAFAGQIAERLGKIDYLIHNACLSRGGILSDCSYEDFLYVLKVGTAAPYLLTRLLLPCFNEGGAVINISSTRAFMSQPDTESYTAAKGGISALTHALAVSLAGRIRVNSVSPGWIDTTGDEPSREDRQQHPVKRIGRPEDIAAMVLFLCSGESGFITGQNVTVDGGMSRMMVYHDDYGWKYTEDG